LGCLEFTFTRLHNKKIFILITENLTPIKNQDAIIRKYDILGIDILSRRTDLEQLATPARTPAGTILLGRNQNFTLNRNSVLTDFGAETNQMDKIQIDKLLLDRNWIELERRGIYFLDNGDLNENIEFIKENLIIERLKKDIDYLYFNGFVGYS
jgi:hypothetical protein